MLLVHAGNRVDADGTTKARFPMSQVDDVTATIARLLRDIRPSAVVSAPANGADLIVLREAQRLAIDVHVVLPLPADVFLRCSVAHGSPMWRALYDEVLEQAGGRPGCTVTTFDLTGDERWFLTANDLLLERARALGDPEDSIVAFTVRPHDGEDPPSVSDVFCAKAVELGLTVLTLDPRPGRAAVIHVD